MKRSLLLIGVVAASATFALAADETSKSETLEPGSVTYEKGLEHWDRVFEVFSSPRCSNCHVGDDNRPMWSGPSYGKTRPHGMNINAGESRIGNEFLVCSTCHQKKNNALPHGSPGIDGTWQLPPAEFAWFGKSSKEVCEQVSDPERNGNRDLQDLADHLGHDAVLAWAWNPGPGRQPAPYTQEDHIKDVLSWGAAGAPCPQG